MGELADILSPSLREELIERAGPAAGRMLKPATVARRQQELANDAWQQREHLARETAEWGVLAWHAGKSGDEVRAIYGQAARAYFDLLQAIDLTRPVEQLYSVTGRDAQETGKRFGGFTRIKRDRFGQSYGVYLAKIMPSDYEAECALTCALIAQDWPLAESLARDIPCPLSSNARQGMTLSLLRYTVLDRKAQVEKRCKLYSTRASGIDFPPRKAEFALAIAQRDHDLLAKALKGTIQTFRQKWKMDKYVTPRWLRQYKTREAVVEVCARRLCGLRWAYSAWAVAMMCLAGCLGMQVPTDPRRFSDFVPQELCVPANREQ